MRKRGVFRGRYSALFSTGLSALDQAYALFHYGTNFRDGYLFDAQLPQPRGSRIWTDAEQFLEWLDDPFTMDQLTGVWEELRGSLIQLTKSTDGLVPNEIKHITNSGLVPDKRALSRAAKQIVAAECHHFLHGIDRDRTERAKPYRSWGRQLDGSDTIVTFNYDLVVETIARTRSTIVVAGTGDSIDDDIDDSRDCPLLIKLHGSVNWQEELDADSKIVGFNAIDQLKIDDKFNPLIAAPGNQKSELREGVFKPLWKLAKERLERATEVHVVGYGLPESDASARELLIESLRNNVAQMNFGIPVVLGAPGFHTARLESMLMTSYAGANVLSMYAQDYLQRYKRDRA
jgi:hypothetical protein